MGRADFLLIYFGSIIGGSLLSLYVHRHHDYLAYGASGGVCGVIFAYILLFPGAGVRLYLSVPIPGWLYAIGFMVVSFVAMKNARDNIGHDAHLGGAIIGLLIAAGLHPQAVSYNWKVFMPRSRFLRPVADLPVDQPALPARALFLRPPIPSQGHGGRTCPGTSRRPLQVDAILDKMAKSGADSLTAEERALLESVSGKLRRRAESKKPESGLAI